MRTIEDREYVEERLEQLLDEWVIGEGATRIRSRDGEIQVQPGCWLIRVEEDLIMAVLYYRTIEAAREAVKRQGQ